MAWCFGDGFDLYAVPADALVGFWDSGTASALSLVTGRFTGSQAMRNVGSPMVKNSGANDSVHHIVCAFQQTATLSGTTMGTYLQLLDASNGQVCIVFRSDGAIVLTSGTPAGAQLAIWTTAVTVLNAWYAFEFEVVISQLAGSFSIRRNGSTSNDFNQSGINTKPSTNAYANRLQYGMSGFVGYQHIDDLLWRSDTSTVAWVGDLRCYTRLPTTDVSTQFGRSPSILVQTLTPNTTTSDVTATARYTPFTPTVTGSIATILASFGTGFTGNCKMAIFTDVGNNPGAVLGSATPVVNPAGGNNTFTFGTPVSVTRGVQYWFGISHDVTATVSINTTTIGRTGATVSYASFPVASPSTSTGQYQVGNSVNINTTVNAEMVSEAHQDATATYVYDSVSGHADLYALGSLGTTPIGVVAVTTRAYVQKSDAGFRSGTVQIKSGATTYQTPTVTLGTNFAWTWRTDVLDPNTGAPWTPTNVSALQFGPIVV